MRKFTGLRIIIALIVASFFFIGCTPKNEGVEAGASENKLVKLGITGAENEAWTHVKNELAKENITLDIISFADYTRPNLALSDGEVDLNAFQHYAFFDNFVVEHNLDLTVIGETVIAPIGLYSSKIEEVGQLKEGDTVAIPNDGTNGGRSLILLQTAGLIKLDDEIETLPTIQDIVENKLNLDIIEIDASTAVRILDDVAAAIINSGFAVDAGMNPIEESIFLEPIDDNSKPYINVIAARTKDKDNELYKKVIAAYQTAEVRQIIADLYKGAQVTPW